MPRLPEDLNLSLLHACAASSLPTLLSLILTDKSFHASFTCAKLSILQTAIKAHLPKSYRTLDFDNDDDSILLYIDHYPDYYSSNLVLARLSRPNVHAAEVDAYIQRLVKVGIDSDVPTAESLQAALGMHQRLCWLIAYLRPSFEVQDLEQAAMLTFGDWYMGVTVELLQREFQRTRRLNSWGWRDRIFKEYVDSIWEIFEAKNMVIGSLEMRSREIVGCYWGPEESIQMRAGREKIYCDVWKPCFQDRPLLMLERCVQRTEEGGKGVIERAKNERDANAQWMEDNKWLRLTVF